MKKLVFALLLACTPPIFSNTEWEAAPLFELENSPPPFYPFSISGEFLSVKKTDFRTSGLEDTNLKYGQWGGAFAYTQPLSEVWGLIFGVGWIGTEVDMKDNPDFEETIFNYVNLSIGGFTKGFPDWIWTATLAAFFDTEELSLADYTLYQGVLWGKYDFCRWLEFDVGFIAETGLNKDKIWPILGFIFLPAPDWRLNAIYPINIGLEYDFNECLTVAGSFRFLRNRHRVGKDEPNSQGIFEYHTWGGEFDLIYNPFEFLSIKGFVGSTFDGDLVMTDRRDNNGRHFKFDGSFYAGATAILSY